jgi:hypothetical protein
LLNYSKYRAAQHKLELVFMLIGHNSRWPSNNQLRRRPAIVSAGCVVVLTGSLISLDSAFEGCACNPNVDLLISFGNQWLNWYY